MVGKGANGEVNPSPLVYGKDENFYTMNLHYNRKIIYNGDGKLVYVVGKVIYWDWIDPNAFFLCDIDCFLESSNYFKELGFSTLEEFRNAKGFSYFWKVDGKRVEEQYVQLRSNANVLDMGLKVVNEKKVADVYLIEKEEFGFALDDAILTERIMASRVPTYRLDGKRKNDAKDALVGKRTSVHSESEASSSFHDSENEPSGDEHNDAVDFDAKVVREPFHIDSSVAVDIKSDCGDSDVLKSVNSSDEEGRIGIDGNYGIFPIAYAMVGVENGDNWKWFLQYLCRDLDIEDSTSGGWTFMSDKQKGLMNALRDVVPYAEHRCCVRHLWTNLQRTLGGTKKTKDLFWYAARSTYEAEFDLAMTQLKHYNPAAYNWLRDKPFEQWTKFRFQTFCKSDLLLNNHCESWNRCILDARCKPIISMFETIRCQLMERFRAKKTFAANNFRGKLCPRIQKKLNIAIEASNRCEAIPNGANCFEVKVHGIQLVVDLNKFTCTCRKWELSGIPCSHAISCIHYMHDKPEHYVDKCFEVSKYIEAYSFSVSPMVGHESWKPSSRSPVKPPHVSEDDKKRRGRRQTKRRKGPEENPSSSTQTRKHMPNNERVTRKAVILRCSVCRATGHNKSKHKLDNASTPLRVLNVSLNRFTGSIPLNITKLAELKVLDLSMNQLRGRLPSQLGLLLNLQVLNLGRNLLSGPIPGSISNISSLLEHHLSTNSLSGFIPGELDLLRSLKVFDLTINVLTGIVPSSIYNMSSLTYLTLASNQLWVKSQGMFGRRFRIFLYLGSALTASPEYS
ncbi:LRR receptor-like serine/threonine-protein kinase FLS2 [Linum grandiflorum]